MISKNTVRLHLRPFLDSDLPMNENMGWFTLKPLPMLKTNLNKSGLAYKGLIPNPFAVADGVCILFEKSIL